MNGAIALEKKEVKVQSVAGGLNNCGLTDHSDRSASFLPRIIPEDIKKKRNISHEDLILLCICQNSTKVLQLEMRAVAKGIFAFKVVTTIARLI